MKFELEIRAKDVERRELVLDLQRVASGLNSTSLTRSEYRANGKYGGSIFTYRFGSWTKALEEAGLTSGKSRDRVETEDLLADLKAVALKLKATTLTRNEYNQNGKFHTGTFEARFGSWIAAKKRAGLERKPHPKVSETQVMENLQTVWERLGRQPRFSEMKGPLSIYSGTLYQRRYGSWSRALERFVEYVNGEDETNEGQPESTTNRLVTGQPPDIVVRPTEEGSLAQGTRRKKANNARKPAPTNLHWTKRQIGARLRFNVMKRDNFKCRSCGRAPATDQTVVLHVDHIVPWSKGGEP